MGICRYCDGDGTTCDNCGSGIGDEVVTCEECFSEFCGNDCKEDHMRRHE